LFSLASCKFDKQFQGFYTDNDGIALKFQGLNNSEDGLKTIVDEHACLRFCDFVNPFFRLSALEYDSKTKGGYFIDTTAELRRFFAKADQNGHMHIYDDRGIVKDEHNLNIWVPYKNQRTNKTTIK